MPSSHYFQLNEIIDLVVRTNPGTLLDIGTGFGKYGFLSREYLELWDEQADYHRRTRRIDGIEAFGSYITPLQEAIYDTIYRGDALKILPGMDEKYDLVLLIDVLEHFSREDGMKVLSECSRISRNILVSVPREMAVQDEVFGNPYEAHKYQWTKQDFSLFPGRFFVRNFKSLICFIGEESARIGREVKKERSRRRLVGFLDSLGIKDMLKKLLIKRTGHVF